jgi:hypothetical protein
VIENVVHDQMIVIDEKKIHAHVHVPKEVTIVVKVEKIKNLDAKFRYKSFVIYIFVYELSKK